MRKPAMSNWTYVETTFYFIYGTDDDYPFRGGWTKVVAPNAILAINLFLASHPVKEDFEIINCAHILTEDEFKATDMPRNGNHGAWCHEEITVTRHLTEASSAGKSVQ